MSAQLTPKHRTSGIELMLGCGHSRVRQITTNGQAAWRDLVTLDLYADCGADVVHDLNVMPYPLDSEGFDEIHAYDVIEHIGKQGDYLSFFALFNELHRILRPNGMVYATTPLWDSTWAWSDPGHTRVISADTLTFLDRSVYEECDRTPRTDYRWCYKGDFEIVHAEEVKEKLAWVLRKR